MTDRDHSTSPDGAGIRAAGPGRDSKSRAGRPTQGNRPAAPGTPRRSIGARRNPDSAAAILSAAGQVLEEAGYAGFSIEAVARRARAGKPTVYRWWPSKAALLLDIYHRRKGAIAAPDTGTLKDDLTAFLDELFRYWRDGGAGTVFRSIVAEAQSAPAAAEALASYAEERRAMVARMVTRAFDRGEITSDRNAPLLAELVIGFAWTRLLTGRIDDPRENLEAIARQLIDGLGAEGAD